MSAIIHRFKHSSDNSSSAKQLAQLLEKITDCLNEELSDLVGRMFDGADDMLFQLAENADSNEDQANYFETMRMLRIERAQVGNKFASNLNDRLQPVPLKSEKSIFDEDELSLVDQSEMEELVAISAMHSKAMNLYGEAVRHLEARIEHLSLKNAHTFSKDSLAPKSLCDAFKDALVDIELSTNNKLILYKLFDQEVILHLENFYQKLNQLFIDEGILPQIKLSSNKSEPRKITPLQYRANQLQMRQYLETTRFTIHLLHQAIHIVHFRITQHYLIIIRASLAAQHPAISNRK